MAPTAPEPEHEAPPFEVLLPERQSIPLVLASPHSGRLYPARFRALSTLSDSALRRSEDSFVDDLFAEAPLAGAPLVRATFARAFLDLNREPFELDPEMFDGPLPSYVNTSSPRVAAGLGTLAKVVGTGTFIYSRPLTFAEAKARIDAIHTPYHAALSQMITATRARFGCCVLLDCHSMPTLGQPRGPSSADVVLGDCHGLACAPLVMDAADRFLTEAGFRTARNSPYAGGFTTGHYGRPDTGIHALQIELARSLYMNEATHERLPGFSALRVLLGGLVRALGALPRGHLMPRAAQ